MSTIGNGVSYEIICFTVFLAMILGFRYLWKRDKVKAENLLVVGLVGLFFGMSWEPQGTQLVWSYPGYSFYAFMDIPLALILSWSWWMVVCKVVSHRIEGLLKKIHIPGRSIVSTTSMCISGILVALMVEPFSVALGWWNYLVVGEKAVLNFPFLGVRINLAVIVGWGILTTINLTLSRKARTVGFYLSKKIGLSTSTSLGLASGLLGLLSGWSSWQLVGLLAAFMEGESPRVFFTRYHIFILEGVSSAQLIGILMVTLTLVFYIWSKRTRWLGRLLLN